MFQRAHAHTHMDKINLCIDKSIYLKEYVTIYYSKQCNQTLCLKFLHFSISKNLQAVSLHPLPHMAVCQTLSGEKNLTETLNLTLYLTEINNETLIFRLNERREERERALWGGQIRQSNTSDMVQQTEKNAWIFVLHVQFFQFKTQPLYTSSQAC